MEEGFVLDYSIDRALNISSIAQMKYEIIHFQRHKSIMLFTASNCRSPLFKNSESNAFCSKERVVVPSLGECILCRLLRGNIFNRLSQIRTHRQTGRQYMRARLYYGEVTMWAISYSKSGEAIIRHILTWWLQYQMHSLQRHC